MTAPDLSTVQHHHRRAFVAHKPKWQRYQPVKSIDCNTTYSRQYAHVYHARLAVLSKQIWQHLDTADKVRVDRILDLVEGTERSCVAGTLVREQGDHVLEDESGRVVLAGTDSYPFVTGVVAVLEGVVREGVFHVAAMHVPNPRTALEVLAGAVVATSSESPPADDADPKSILLLSGLNCGDPDTSSLPRDMLLSFLQGCFGVDKAKAIGQVIVSGGLISPSPGASRAEALKDLDAWMLQTASCGIFVDVLPGKDDPTTANWPQRPMHASLLPQSATLGNNIVHRTPNPYAAQLDDDTLVVGTDGTNVQDLLQQLNSEQKGGAAAGDETIAVSELDALELILGWSHLCPNGPDSVPTVPHADVDPMVMERVPNLLFSGNASQFATSTVGPCRLVCVPKFSATGQAVLVHLHSNNLPPSVEVLCFKAEEENSPN
jgi:DNA polymerase delta subunit 2